MMRNHNYPTHTYRHPIVTVNMTDRDVIERAGMILGATRVYVLRPSGRARLEAYKVEVYSHRAVAWMRLLLPNMGQRRGRRIEEILAEWNERSARPRTRRVSNSPRPITGRLSEEAVAAIRVRYKQGVKGHAGYGNSQQLADEFGVHRNTILNVVARKTWTHLA